MKSKKEIIQWLEDHGPTFVGLADEIWEHPEVALKEFRASKLLMDFLIQEQFNIQSDLAGMNTAFMAQWGTGKPILGFAGEFDALKGLSQTRQPFQKPVVKGGPGHGCGHNLLGVGVLAAALAAKTWLQATGRSGTIRYYGCPAEEILTGKVFMARAGLFDDLDAAFNFHPMYANMAMKGSMVGTTDIKFKFHGKSAHAGAAPHLGRSALDAVELMNIGVNYLREHVLDNVRLHYVITNGGDVPNVVPSEAEVWYFIRAFQPQEMQEVLQRVRNIADGAALMTDTSVETEFRAACSRLLSNHYLADLQHEAMQLIGPLVWSEEEFSFAREIQTYYPEGTTNGIAASMGMPVELAEKLLLGDNMASNDEHNILTGSSDVGDLSWKAPLSMLTTACFPTCAPIHTWGAVAAAGTTIGHKGMLHAAKIMALTAIELFSNDAHLKAIHNEFDEAVKAHPYKCPISDDVRPARFEPIL